MLRSRINSSREGPSDEVRACTYPPPFPDAWYRIAASKELRPGQLRYIECLGRQIVIYRSEDGKSVHAMKAFCPHLGANLAHGRVCGTRVECPFHQWQLCADGRVGHVPYSQSRLSARHETFPVRERYGQIFLYHRSGGGPARADEAPPYELIRVPEIDDGRFVERGSYDGGRVRMHLTEFAENSADHAHFVPLHSRMFVPWTRIPIPGVELRHEAEWKLDPDRPHVATFVDRGTLHVLGRKLDKTQARGEATFFGPGGVVLFHFNIPDVGNLVLFQTHLPVAPLEQQVNFHWFAEPKIPRLMVSYVVGAWVSQWKNDIEIWENKIYQQRPLLAKGDGPVHRLRRWLKQFYPEQSSGAKTVSATEAHQVSATGAVMKGSE